MPRECPTPQLCPWIRDFRLGAGEGRGWCGAPSGTPPSQNFLFHGVFGLQAGRGGVQELPKGVLRGCWDIPAAAAWGLSLLLLIPVGASRWPGALGARGPGVSTASGQRPQRVTSAAPAPGEDIGRSGPSARPGRGNPSEKRWNPSRSRHREAAEGAGAAAPGDLGDPQAATSVAIREKSSSESRPSGRIPFFTRSPCLSLRFPAGIFSRDL